MIKHIYIHIISLIALSNLYSQNTNQAEQLLNKIAAQYNQEKSFNYTTQYTLYQNQTNNKIHEQYSGYIIKKGADNYYKIKNTEFVSIGNYGFKINHEQKAMVVSKSTVKATNPLEMGEYMKSFAATISKTAQGKTICTLLPKNKIVETQIKKIEIQVNPKNNQIEKQTIYYAQAIEISKTKTSIPRLEIIFSPRTKNEKADAELFKLDNYITLLSGKIKAAKRFIAYTLYQS